MSGYAQLRSLLHTNGKVTSSHDLCLLILRERFLVKKNWLRTLKEVDLVVQRVDKVIIAFNFVQNNVYRNIVI